MNRRLTGLVALAAVPAFAVGQTSFAHGTHEKQRAKKLQRGSTTVTLDAAAADALSGVTIKALRPGKGTQTTGAIRFPLVAGRVALDTSGEKPVVKRGWIAHVGGLKLSKGEKSVRLRNPFVTITRGGAKVSVKVPGLRKRFVLATADLAATAPTVTKDGRKVTATGVELKLTKRAAGALVALFALDAEKVKESTVLGTASVTARVAGKRVAHKKHRVAGKRVAHKKHRAHR